MANRCDVRFDGVAAVVSPAGDVDLAMTGSLRDALAIALTREGTTRVIVDLVRATYLDSEAIGLLMAAYRAARRNGGGLTVVRPGPVVRLVLGVAGVLHVLSAEADSPAAAVTSFGDHDHLRCEALPSLLDERGAASH